MTVTVKGAERLATTLKRAAEDLAEMTEANAAVSKLVAAAAAGGCPRRTGRLAGSIQPAPEKGMGVVHSALPYAGPIHWGWQARHIRPSLFAWNAALRLQPQWEELYADGAQEILDRVQGA